MRAALDGPIDHLQTAECKLQSWAVSCASQAPLCVQDMQEKAGLKVYTWEDFLELGRKHPAEPIPPKPQDLCTIMYTSGTTGNPKVLTYPASQPQFHPSTPVCSYKICAAQCI